MSVDPVRITAETVVDGVVPRDPAVSPDGRWVAYAVTALSSDAPRPTSALWVTAVDGSSPPRQLTDGASWDHRPRWAPDSRQLYFLSDRTETAEATGAGEAAGGGAPQLHRTNADGSGHRVLTSFEGGVVNHLPLAGQALVAVVVADPDHRGIAPRVWGEPGPRDRLALLDTGTATRPADQPIPITGLGEHHVQEISARPDGRTLAVITHPTPHRDPVRPRWELHLLDTGTGKIQDLGALGWDAHSPAWWHDDQRWHLSYLAMQPGPDGGQAVFDLIPDSEQAAPADLTEGLDRCPLELAQVAQGPPLALFAHGLDTEIHRLDPRTRSFTRLATVPGLLESLTSDHTGARVAVQAANATHPREVYSADAGDPARPPTRLTRLRPELERFDWGAQKRLSYRARDGLTLDGLLVTPVGRVPEDGPVPLVTWVHGGPYGRYMDQFTLDPHAPAQWLAHFGYAVFLPNPRGGEGHGQAFAEQVVGALGAGEWDDISDGIDLLVERGVADPARLGIGGWSHGGTMAAWAVGHTDRFRAAVVGAGVTDWGMLAATGEYGASEAGLSGSVGWEGTGPHPHDAVSPISFASRMSTPVLIVHGEADTNVPLSQAVYLHRALRHYGVEQEFVVYPGAGHGLARRDHQIDLLERTRAWFDRWLGRADVK
ncbi:S9 family peptidase [Nocardiopsis exhalans]|uniref:S9 family peptidase n=1 Tax=Nocardiopsis exhalans TaxID=163604 RepID=A0ABY5CZT2_9ACTN|nr:S9 family peptidase [Nocardiopsis exhalans]USY17085.1 S9 family peptidase [Nocardiopsis exhalans]